MSSWAGSALWIIAIGVAVDAAMKPYMEPDIILFGTLAKTEGNLILNCTAHSYSPAQFVGVNWTRTKDNITLEYIDASHITTNFTANKIISTFNANHKHAHGDIGDYKCVIFNKNNSQPLNTTLFRVKAAPYPVNKNHVRRLKEQNSAYVRAVQSVEARGDEIAVHCNTSGYPKPKITWYRVLKNLENEDELINSTMEIVDKNRTKLKDDNMTLLMTPTEESDRGYYVCVSDNEVDPPLYVYTLVRVKSRYAPLWPFLVLIGEFLLLGLIIGLCELRRKRSCKDEDDNSKSHTGSGNASTSAGHVNSSGDVRQRTATKCN